MSEHPRRKLGVYSLGFLKNRALREALRLAGWDVVAGPLQRDIDAIGVWGGRPVASRGVAAAKRRGLPVLYIEDAPLRSVTPDASEPIMGLTLDESGNYLDCAGPSALENLLNSKPLAASPGTDAALEAYLRSKLSKYNADWRLASELPDGPFVLVVDQLPDDASIGLGGADASSFARMLKAAIGEHPGLPVYVKRHPRAEAAPGRGHFAQLPDGVGFLEHGFGIADVLDRAQAVYCVSSQVGFEAILRGHTPRVFGGAFYAGWGLSADEMTLPRRLARHSVLSLFEGAMIDYPLWFDVYANRQTGFLPALHGLEARRAAYRRKRGGAVALGMRLWKRRFVRDVLGDTRFCDDPAQAGEIAANEDRKLVVWASARQAERLGSDVDALRMEDGFLRSVGLGAELVEPMSACLDDLGIYYDPTQASRLERLIDASRDLSEAQLARARALRLRVLDAGLSKYNIGAGAVEVPDGKRVILVPGQVADDASMRLGAGAICANIDLLELVRSENPDAHILYKPHPDVEAGLRTGAVAMRDLARLADHVLCGVSAEAALASANEVWTMTSLMGFEGLLRGKKTVCFGRPFYAGWGLTDDRGGLTERRSPGISLDGLVHASLIDYPMYQDPLTRRACPVETVVDRLCADPPPFRPAGRVLSKLQGIFASQSWLWR